jgi:hypothetical protein
MKLTISKYNFRDRPVAEQVAFLVDDLITAVENG